MTVNIAEKPKVLVADDEKTIRIAFEGLLTGNNYEPIMAKDGNEALELFKKFMPPVCIVDFKMPGMDGIELLKAIRKIKENTFVIIITAHADMEKTIEAMKSGAYDFLKKPFDNDDILNLVHNAFMAYDSLTAKPPKEPVADRFIARNDSEFKIIGNSPKMQKVYNVIGKIFDSPVTVMITGESGSGKEMIARAIHLNSSRAGKPFVAINCSAIPENLIESELFGHEKGSFTGAINKKIGKFELANAGTLFLDEVAEMPLEMQTKFLRVLQEKEIVRVGGNEVVKVDVRIIAATNIDLEEALQKGKLREDLYHRLKVISIHVPPLRERREDIPNLVRHFIELYNKEFNKKISGLSADLVKKFIEFINEEDRERLKKVFSSFSAELLKKFSDLIETNRRSGRKIFEMSDDLNPLFLDYYRECFNRDFYGISPEVMDFFMNYDWPGNVRELKNVMESAVAICRENDNAILLEHLPQEIIEKHDAKKNMPSPQEAARTAPRFPGEARFTADARPAEQPSARSAPARPAFQPQAGTVPHPAPAEESARVPSLQAHATTDEDLIRKLDEDLQSLISFKLSSMGTLEKSDFYDFIEKILIDNVLKKFNGNQVKASKFLGINRNTLRSKIEKYSLSSSGK